MWQTGSQRMPIRWTTRTPAVQLGGSRSGEHALQGGFVPAAQVRSIRIEMQLACARLRNAMIIIVLLNRQSLEMSIRAIGAA